MDSVSIEMYQVFFVLESGITEKTTTSAMKSAFACAVKEKVFEPEWITAKEVLHFDSSKPTLFVCDPFEGAAFNHLSKSGNQIVGPLCIEVCLQKGEPIPCRSYPVYSTCMRKLVVTFTGLDKDLREDLARKVRLMCGIYNRDLTQSITHVVASDITTKKYKTAVKFKIPNMLPDWVDQCWIMAQHKKKHATDQWSSKFVTPPFKDLFISVSQLEPDERKKVKKLVQENGGNFSGTVRAKETTHIILLRPEGDKYKFGKSWNCLCVTPAWLYDSVEEGCSLEEEKYLVHENDPREHGSSTPKKGQTPNSLQVNDCSVISNATVCSKVDDTVLSDVSFFPTRQSMVHPLDVFNINDIPKDCQFLDGCCIFLYGFTGSHLEKAQRIINAGGGTRYSKLLDSVTHVILKEKSNLKTLSIGQATEAHVVTFHWLLDCCKQMTLVDETEYLCVTKALFSPSKSPSIVNRAPEANGTESNVSNSTVGITNGFTTNCSFDYDALMEQYMPARSEVPEVSRFESNDATSTTKIVGKNADDLTIYNGREVKTHIFSNMTFLFAGFAQSDLEPLVDIVVSNGGTICKQGQETDFEVVPLLFDVHRSLAKSVVTCYWLQRCAEEEAMLDIDSDRLCMPLSLKPNCLPLVGCVLSVSQYVGIERDALKHLAEVLGATCQDYLVGYPNKNRNLLPNTHLVLKEPKDDKYKGAKRWNIPAVTKFWLIATALSGLKAREEDFFVESAQQESSMLERKNLECVVTKNDDTSKKSLRNETSFNKFEPETKTKDDSTERSSGFVEGKSTVKKKIENSRVRELIEDDLANTSRDFLNSDFRPRFDMDGVLSGFDTPPLSQTSKKRSVGIDELVTHHLKMATKNIGMENSFSEFVPLSGVILCVAKKLADLQGPLNRLCGNLGGDYRWSYDKSCTHFVYQGKAGEASSCKELKCAKEHGKKIVSPDWLYACRDEQKHVDESLFPFTYNPRLDLSSQVASVSTNHISALAEENAEDQTDSKSESLEITMSKSEDHDSAMSSAMLLDVSKQLKELMTATTSAKVERRRSRRTNSSSGSPSPADSASKAKVHPHFRSIPADPEPQPSQSVPITWDDPMGRLEQEKIAEQLSHCPETQNTQSQEVDYTETTANTMTFMLSGFKESDKMVLTEIIIKLGGCVLDTKSFEPAATHLVMASLLKNEKFLSSIASGKWVLKRSYLEECDQIGHFVAEEQHEWGADDSATSQLALCSRRWRHLVVQTQTPAFHDWRVFFFCPMQSKRETLQRVLEAGGATVLPSVHPYDSSLEATLAIIELPKNSSSAELVDYAGLEAAGVKCVKAEYIASFLVDKNPQLERYLIGRVANNSSLVRKRKTEKQSKNPKRSCS